jgi:hypothetical protein
MYLTIIKLHYGLSGSYKLKTLDAFARPLRDTHPVQSEFIFGGKILFVIVRTQKMPLVCGGLSSCRLYDLTSAKVGNISGTFKFFREKVSFWVQNFSVGLSARARAYLYKKRKIKN